MGLIAGEDVKDELLNIGIELGVKVVFAGAYVGIEVLEGFFPS